MFSRRPMGKHRSFAVFILPQETNGHPPIAARQALQEIPAPKKSEATFRLFLTRNNYVF